MYPVFTHPSPLPEGEGTDWGILKRFTDVKDMQ